MSFGCCSQGIGVEAQSKVLSEHYCNKSGHEDMLMQRPITGQNTSYGRDWMMMMDMGPRPSYPSSSVPVPYCNMMMMNSPKIPLKTLELFPISSINSKQDSSKL
ncbi:WUSCHEL-related homeobox 3 [Raphanus sativus]|nr:WUSCHEL-related homeobox 3 [Raphanus sativus]